MAWPQSTINYTAAIIEMQVNEVLMPEDTYTGLLSRKASTASGSKISYRIPDLQATAFAAHVKDSNVQLFTIALHPVLPTGMLPGFI